MKEPGAADGGRRTRSSCLHCCAMGVSHSFKRRFPLGGSAVISAPHIFLLLLSDSPFVSSVAPSAAESVCSQAGHDFIETQ